MHQLQDLDISDCPRLTDRSVIELATVRGPRLVRLVLNGLENLSDHALAALTYYGKGLECLEFSRCNGFTEGGLKILGDDAEYMGSKALRELSLGGLQEHVDGQVTTGLDTSTLKDSNLVSILTARHQV